MLGRLFAIAGWALATGLLIGDHLVLSVLTTLAGLAMIFGTHLRIYYLFDAYRAAEIRGRALELRRAREE